MKYIFREKDNTIETGKHSLGLILEYHKSLWPISCLFFTLYHNNLSIRNSMMSAFFSVYGILWVIKSNTFYDKLFYFDKQYHHNLLTSIINFSSINVYFLYPYLSSTNQNEITSIETFLACSLFSVGGFFHYAADSQKFYTLKYKPGHLIKDGLFSIVRHPSYFGEFLMWFGLSTISGYNNIYSYIPILWLFMATVLIGIPRKEKSLSKYPDFLEYVKNTSMLFPGDKYIKYTH
tara:strand:+ start:164 stop:865 length:702 start_codon:yes stop_codon:yes gene_type:complete